VHLNAKLSPREDKDNPITLRLAEAAPTRAAFRAAESEKRVAAATYERVGADTLRVRIEFQDPARQPLNFEFKRAAGTAK
jgi:hypothetical protein